MAVTVTGIDEVIRLFRQVDNVSQKVVTKAAKAGANIPYKQAKRDAPQGKTKNLKKAIKMKAEKRKRGKKVYDIKFVGDGLVKISKDGKRSFYPVSQEYGWMGRDGNKIVPRKARYLRNSIDQNRNAVEQKILDVMAEELRRSIT